MKDSGEAIRLAHGNGGQLSHELIRDVFIKHFANAPLCALGDAAVLECGGEESLSGPCRLAFTTDSYVISPLFFPGGDIGKLAVCGTVNDLAVSGARPLYLSAGFILEEGLPLELLERIVISMADTARVAGVEIVTGDTKVVNRGAADGLFINTAGIGLLPAGLRLGPAQLQPGDQILVSGTMGDHGTAIMLQREGFTFTSALTSDCAPLNGMIAELLRACAGQVRCMRDPTRGGLVSTLNEWALAGHVGIVVEQSRIPIRAEVQGICELLGLDPLYVANEGKVVVAVAAESAEKALAVLRAHPLGQDAAIIGQVTAEHPGRAVLRTALGSHRVLDMLVEEQLPRIC
jgi:hydrogenase expression/formation protein HypE